MKQIIGQFVLKASRVEAAESYRQAELLRVDLKNIFFQKILYEVIITVSLPGSKQKKKGKKARKTAVEQLFRDAR